MTIQDADGNSYLTLEEFTKGFGHFLGLEAQTATVEEERLVGQGLYSVMS